MPDKPSWLKGNSDVEWSYNIIAEWLSSGVMRAAVRPGNEGLAELQKLIYAALTTARHAAAQDAYEQAIQIASRYDAPCDPRTEAEETAHQIARGIHALATAEAGKDKEE